MSNDQILWCAVGIINQYDLDLDIELHVLGEWCTERKTMVVAMILFAYTPLKLGEEPQHHLVKILDKLSRETTIKVKGVDALETLDAFNKKCAETKGLAIKPIPRFSE